MLSETELDNLSNELGAFRLADLQHLLQSYQDVLGQYRRLKSDYEEEKESREKYKQLSKSQERNPFVLVLVDGDGYIFQDQLIRAGADGGVAAAQLLSNEVKACLGSDAGHYRIMVRIYANLAGLSKALSKAGMAGPEKRSLAPFTASFTRAQELFDFVDAGEKKEGADYKIREMFRLFVDNSQCKHIFFGGCHDVGYLSMLTPFQARADKISLIRSAAFSSEYNSLGLKSVEFLSVFRQTPLVIDYNYPKNPPKRPTSPIRNDSIPGPAKENAAPWGAVKATPYSKPVCKFYQMGICKYGNSCKNAHVNGDASAPAATYKSPQQTYSSPNWRKPQHQSQPFGAEATNGADYHEQRDHTSRAPIPTPLYEGLIPINKDGHRLDTFLPSPPAASWALYAARTKGLGRKTCNNFQLTGKCSNVNCSFDHSEMPQGTVDVIRYMLRQIPCKHKGYCRSKNCVNGHTCDREGCTGPGKGCKLNRAMHGVDMKVVDWIEPGDDISTTARTETQDDDYSEGSTPDADMESTAGASLSPSIHLVTTNGEVHWGGMQDA